MSSVGPPPAGNAAGGVVPLRRIYAAFFRLGLTGFGGPAMVAYIKELAVTRHGWLDQPSFGQGVAVCQTIPGATAMQAAAYVGLRVRGLAGGLAAYLGFGLPAFGLLLTLSVLYAHGHDLPVVVVLCAGLRAMVVGLLANATISFAWSTLKSRRDGFLALLAAVALTCHASPVLALLGCAAMGALLRGGGAPAASPAAHAGRGLWRPLAWLVAGAAAALGALRVVDNELFALSVAMLRIDLLAFGGGFASVPLMQHEFVNVRHWIDAGTFMDGIALGQVTPGPIVITATFVGYLVGGVAGALVATVSIFAPSFVILTLSLPVMDRLRASAAFGRALQGVLAAFVGLLLSVTLQFGQAVDWTPLTALLAVGALIALRCRVDLLWVVLTGVVASVLGDRSWW